MKNKTKLRFNQSNVKEEKNDLHQLEQACQIYKSSYETDISQQKNTHTKTKYNSKQIQCRMMKFKRKTITKNQKNTKQAKQVNQTL